MPCLEPYRPLNTLKPIAAGVWIADGPLISFGFAGLHVPFPTRMTVVRLADGGLWVHSPTLPTEPLLAEIAALGEVRHLVAPSKLHYWWIGEWKLRFPTALTYAAPGVRDRAKGRIAAFDCDLGERAPPEWQGEIDMLLVPGDIVTEAEFFHHPSGTLVLTDLIENFEPDHVTCWHLRLLLRLGGVTDPDGRTPRDMRLTQLRHRPAVRAAVERMLAWQPERIVIAHGRWYERDAARELRRAFRWVLD